MSLWRIKLPRGKKENLPTLSLGEPAYITDEGELYIGGANGENINITNNTKLKAIVEDNVVNARLQGIPIKSEGDCTNQLNSLISKISNGDYGTNTLDLGGFEYLISGEIQVPWGINIIGNKAIFYITHTDGYGLKLKGRHIIKDIACVYPNQDMTGMNIITYPAFIGTDGNVGYTVLDNIGIGNSYIGIDFSNGVSGGAQISNVYGYPLYRGLIVDNCIDIVHVDRVHFNPNYFGVPSLALKRWVFENGIAIEAKRWDFGNINKLFAWGYNALVKFVSSTTGTGAPNNISFTNWYADACMNLALFNNHDGGILFSNGIGTFYYPYTEDTTPPTLPNFVINVTGGGSSKWSSKVVKFIGNRIYRVEKHFLKATNPIICIGNEITGYANQYTTTDTTVIDAIQLESGSDGSIIADCLFDGKNKASNRCIAISNSYEHKISNNKYLGWKSNSVYGYANTNTLIDGRYVCTTINRPTTDLLIGTKAFDTTINKEITWNGTTWVDPTGATDI